MLFVNDIDKDGSGTPDYMDGWGCTFQQIPLLEREKISSHRMVNPANRFVPFSVAPENLPPGIDKGNVLLRFDYPESPPETLQRVALTGSSWDNVGPQGRDPAYKVTSPTGNIRIWKKDGTALRNVATDYVRSNQTLITYSELQSLSTPGRLYLEAVNACTNWSGVRIMVSLSLDNGNTWVASNAVRVTSMRCNFTVGVVRQYYRTQLMGSRVVMEPDYSTPAGYLRYVADCNIEHETYFELPKYVPGMPGRPKNDWWHEEDAILGHGFAYFQYEGPDLGNALSAKCSANHQFDKKFYWGKTGSAGFTHWDYETDGCENTQEELAWWDICPYKIEDKFLVLKQTYTLKPERANNLFAIFNQGSGRYENFGLHINTAPAVKGWGCLSNVGLAMEENNLDVANITQCVFNKNLPTTVNKSVWEVIMGTQAAFYEQIIPQGKAGFGIMKDVIDVVVSETHGLSWDGFKIISAQAGGTLQGRLFNTLNGKTIMWRNPNTSSGTPLIVGTVITSVNDVSVYDSGSINLRFYDPGRFPLVFGERPVNVFNVEQ